MNNLGKSLKYFTSAEFIESVIIIVIASILLWAIKQYLIKKVAYKGKDSQHKNTFIGMIFNVLQYLVIIIAAVVVLQINGVNVGSILAGLGIVATIVGLALQDTLKDIISGINIYNNNFYKVGDMVRWNGEECDVKYFSARVTKFQSILSNSTYTVNNSLINNIEKIKDTRAKIFRFRFDENRKKIDKAFNKIVERMKSECEFIKDCIFLGVVDMNYEGVDYGIMFKCPAHKYLPTIGKLVNVAYEEFTKAGIMPDQNSFSVDTTKIK